MASSSNTKAKLIKRLEKKFGANWKTPLAAALGVNLSTVRRVFNESDTLNQIWIRAINDVLNEPGHKGLASPPASQ